MLLKDRELNDRITALRADASEESLAQATELEREREDELAQSDLSDDELAARGYDPGSLREAYADGPPEVAGNGGGETADQLVKQNTREELDVLARTEGLDPDFDTKAEVAQAIVKARKG